MTFAAGFVGAAYIFAQPVLAQGIDLLQDTETERLLRSYEDPILKVAGIDPGAVKMYIVNDTSLNAFVAEGQNIFVNAGLFIQLKSPNELKGVLAHETGHMAGGHLIRDSGAIAKAEIPMLLSMVVGLGAAIAGAGEAGMILMGMGQSAAQAEFLSFSRVQEATADQMGQRFLRETHQSGEGMVHVFERMADEAAAAGINEKEFASDHPADRDRVALLQEEADASPYRDVPDSPQSIHAFEMVKAKVIGYLLPVQEVFNHYPLSDKSEAARYAHAMVFMRQPNLPKALEEIKSLIKDEPKNPYFYEVLGQIYVSMGQPGKGITPYQTSVNLLPDAPELRVSLAAAQVATENKIIEKAAVENLKIALQQDSDQPFGWYEMAQAYSDLGNEPMANLSTAERYYSIGALRPAAVFAGRAQKSLDKGSPDWERANDIISVAASQLQQGRAQD
ncbi:MAG: M48 family metalloprotease [Alphaproteobacteria bacterium]|nr:M48 family metalloprotease [Alphaproteobacteria bacterium]MDE1985783.1 M48 family metalloprotease [Alphaproteobacteria bacterium]MDE2163799.1 M48 family metalloprotease [Alphaproteobacteria bacterium]MDE2264323.1 M48 family metalloprotease [Alphaproteobacteria bacterium]